MRWQTLSLASLALGLLLSSSCHLDCCYHPVVYNAPLHATISQCFQSSAAVLTSTTSPPALAAIGKPSSKFQLGSLIYNIYIYICICINILFLQISIKVSHWEAFLQDVIPHVASCGILHGQQCSCHPRTQGFNLVCYPPKVDSSRGPQPV